MSEEEYESTEEEVEEETGSLVSEDELPSEEEDDEVVNEPIALEDDEDTDDVMDTYKEKFTDSLRQNHLVKFHPEEIHKPFDEMYKLSQITRNANGVIEDPLHQTYPILTKYERAKIIGLRVSQLNKGAEPYVKLKNKQLMDVSLIAEKELQEKKLPFILMRPIPNRPAEFWNVNDLEYLY
jgi:DNA-directed RNA polymerase I, II, and III subunit RPABC2